VKVLIAVHHFPPRHTGGAEWRAYRTAAALEARGHQAQVIAIERIDRGPERGVAWEDEVFEGVKVRRLYFDLKNVPDPERWEYDNIWIGEHLRQVIGEMAPDIFHLISGYLMSGRTIRVARQEDIPTVLSLTDFWFLCKRISMLRSDGSVSTLPIDPVQCARCMGEDQRRYRLPAKVVPKLMDIYWQNQKKKIDGLRNRLDFLIDTLQQVNVIISPSQFLRDTYIQAGVDPARIIFSRQGRDFPDLNPTMMNKKPSDRLRVGYIGQISWHKGVHVLFEALSKLPGAPISVKVYGEESHYPDYAAKLRRMADSDSRLDLAGTYHLSEVSRVLQEIDVLVVPSLWYENSPNAILEAFAHKTPVITSALGGMAELVEDGKNGLLFETGSAESLASKLNLLVDEPDLLRKFSMRINPVRPVKEEMDELEEIYSSLVKHKLSEGVAIK
jgi:glycosyltransferase involved in cell wall biosynthesis